MRGLEHDRLRRRDCQRRVARRDFPRSTGCVTNVLSRGKGDAYLAASTARVDGVDPNGMCLAGSHLAPVSAASKGSADPIASKLTFRPPNVVKATSTPFNWTRSSGAYLFGLDFGGSSH